MVMVDIGASWACGELNTSRGSRAAAPTRMRRLSRLRVGTAVEVTCPLKQPRVVELVETTLRKSGLDGHDHPEKTVSLRRGRCAPPAACSAAPGRAGRPRRAR